MIEIIPAILPTSFEELSAKLTLLRGLAKTIQIDVSDGFFVPTKTWPMHTADHASFEAIVSGKETLPFRKEFDFEADLMVQNPEKLLPKWIRAGATRAVIYLESKHDLSLCHRAVSDKAELGLGVDLDPPYERIASYIGKIDYIQIMGIGKLGKQGEPPDPRAYALTKKIRAEYPDVTIQVDGGVNHETAAKLVAAGANRLVVGSYILRSENPKQTIQELESIS